MKLYEAIERIDGSDDNRITRKAWGGEHANIGLGVVTPASNPWFAGIARAGRNGEWIDFPPLVLSSEDIAADDWVEV